MGAKQSKRSVDISGKEAENAGEVAAAGAGGEGRMEALADADALKPQLNGDAHIHEQSDKEKQLDSGTPENEKDATTEKESKDQEDEKDKDAPVANGENGEQKENGESTPAPEEGKKPKKEKVKKKWSLRSISFSRKEKPKQEKKTKEEEPKTNGEPEKVPEEAAETTAETPKTEAVEITKPETDNKDEKTPETPVTEPITNGSSTPESKVETPAAEEPAVAIPDTNRPEAKAEPEPEQLPVNGLSLEEAKNEPAEVTQSEESKTEEPTAETTESAPAPDIPVKKETKADLPNENVCNLEETKTPSITTVTEANPLPLPLKEECDDKLEDVVKTDVEVTNVDSNKITDTPSALSGDGDKDVAAVVKADPDVHNVESTPVSNEAENEFPPPNEVSEEITDDVVKTEPEVIKTDPDTENEESVVKPPVEAESSDESQKNDVDPIESEAASAIKTEDVPEENSEICISPPTEPEIPENSEALDSVDDLPPPPPADDDLLAPTDLVESLESSVKETSDKVEIISNHVSEIISTETNGAVEAVNGNDGNEENAIENHAKDMLGNVVEPSECNGNGPRDGAASNGDAHSPQEPIPVSDKIADLIPEVPVVPEIKTETETTSDVAVAN